MSCKLIYNTDNQIEGMLAPNGASSTLYPALLQRTQDVQNAVELTTMTHTGGFMDKVVQPILSKYASEVRNRLNTLKPKNSNLQLVYRGKEYTVDIENLQYKVVLTKGFETVQAYAQVGEEKVMLGKVRLKAYKEGMAIESTSLTAVNVYVEGNLESLQGKGIGTEIYKKAINHTLKQGKPFYSDASQTQAAAGVWEKLKATKLVGKEDGRNKIEAYPLSHFDRNHELLPKVVINYVLAKQAEGKQLTFEQKQDVRNALLNSEFKDSQQMSDALQKTFFKDGEFVVEEKRLKEHYNSYEIASILSDKDLQKKIRNTLEALKNTQEVLVSNVYFTDEFLTKSSELNSLGKMVVNNPLLTQQQVIQELGGINNEQEFKEKIENLELGLVIGTTEAVAPKITSLYKERANRVKQQDPKQYWSFDIPSDSQIEEAAASDRIVDVGGGMGIVTEDGNMIGMFKYDNTQKGTAAAVQAACIAKGGLKLDNFDGYLTKLYDKNGFRVVSRVPFNEEYAPAGWDKRTHGTPDVVAMVYDPSYRLDIVERTFDDYKEAINYRDNFAEKIVEGNVVQFSVKEIVDPKEVIYHGMMVADPQALEEAFPAVHPNKFYHHSTVAFRPQDTSNIEVGKAQELKVIGRITTDKVDALLVENPKSANKDAHITLSTAEGIKPFEVNKEIENNREKITAVPEGTTVQATEGYFNGREDVTSVKDKRPFSAVIEKLKETGIANNIYSLTNQEIQAKLSELGVGDTASKQLANGVKVTAAGFTYKGDVYLNTDTMTLDTPIHEMGHLYLNMLRAGGKGTYEVLVKGMNLAKSKEAEAYRSHVKKYQPKLKEGTPEFYEEVLAQAIGDAGAKFIEGASKDGFMDWLEEMWDSIKDVIGLSEYMKDMDNKNSPFKTITFGQFTQAIARDLFDHQTIEGLMASLPHASEGAFLKVNDNPKFKDSQGIDLNAYGVDFIDTTVPVKSLDEVVKEYEGRLYFITSDFTGIGKDSEGDSIEGGVGYLAIKKNVEDKVGFASLDDVAGKSVLTRVKNIFGENKKVAVVVMAQTPSSTLGNYYGAKYFGRGLRALKSTLTPSEFQEAMTSLDNILQNNESIQKAIKSFENSKKGHPLRGPLLDLLHNVENYSSKEFAQEFIKDTTFEIRRQLMKIVFLGDSDVKMDTGTHGIKRSLENAGFNTYNFLKEYGDSTTLTDQMIKDDKGGLLLGGFEMLTTSDAKKEVDKTKGRGIQHPQFNGKVPSNGNHFILDGAYELENNFTSTAEVESQINPEYEIEIKKEFKKFTKNNKTDAKEYKDLSSAHKIKFKGELNKKNTNLLLINAPSVQASVSRGLGVKLSEQGQRDLIEKVTPKFSITKEVWESQRGARRVDGDAGEVAQKQEPTPALKKKAVNNSLFQKMQGFKRMPEMKIEGEELKQVDKNDTKTTLEQTFTVDNGYDLSQDIIYLNTLSQDLYEENPEEVQGLLQEIEKKAARQGVDIIGISEKVFSKSRDEIYDLLEDLNTLVVEPSQENLEAFAKIYDVLFEVKPDVSDKVLKVGESNLKKTLVHLNSKESEYSLFAKHSLIKVAENVYQKVEKSEDLNDLYDKLYQVAQYNERVLPAEAFPLANEGGVLNLSTIRKAENKELLVKDIQSFIENKVAALDLSDTMTENSLLQQMVAFKYFFNNPMVFKNSISLQEEFDNYNNFDGSEAYLTTDFISDFYSDFLKEKIKGSNLFQNFYSHFSVNDRGITIDSDDIITLTKIQDYLDSGSVRGATDLRNYSLLSNQLPNLKKAVETNMEDTREFKRALYTNSPKALDKLNQNYSKLSDSTISVKGSTEEFVRVKSGVYELIEQNNGIGYYERLQENKGDYKTYKVEEPTLSVDSSAYGSLEAGAVQKAVEAKKYYSKQEESKIDDENFDCL